VHLIEAFARMGGPKRFQRLVFEHAIEKGFDGGNTTADDCNVFLYAIEIKDLEDFRNEREKMMRERTYDDHARTGYVFSEMR